MNNLRRIVALLLCLVSAFGYLFSQVTISMEKIGNVFYIPGKVNGVPLEFIFDTGASNVCLSLTEAYFMLKNGYMDESDLGDTSYSQIANGQIVENTNVRLKEIEIGGLKSYNVPAVIVKNLDAPLLLGQSAIQKLGPIQLNGNMLTISNGKNLPSEEQAWSLYQQAYQQVESQNFDEAIATSEKALTFTSNKPLRGLLYDNIGTAYNRKGDHKKAIEAMNKALEEDYMCIQAQYNLGVYYFEDNQLENALRALQLVLNKTDNGTKTMVETMDVTELIANALGYMGLVQSRLRCYKDAENSLIRSLSISPNSMTYLSLADLYASQNDFNKAAENFEKGIAYEPERLSNIKRLHQLGMCYVFSNNYSKAYDAFQRCIDATIVNAPFLEFGMNSDDKEAKNFAAMCYSLSMDAEHWMARTTLDERECIKLYEERIFKNPAVEKEISEDDYIRLHQAYLQLGDTDKAIETINRGLKNLSNNPELLFVKSSLIPYSSREHFEILKQLLSSEYTYNPRFFDFATVNNNIAWYYCLNRKYSEGIQYALKAVRQNPNHDYSWETLGELYFNLGQYNECIDAMTKCIALNGDCKKSAYEFRANSLKALGKKKEANKDLEILKTFH